MINLRFMTVTLFLLFTKIWVIGQKDGTSSTLATDPIIVTAVLKTTCEVKLGKVVNKKAHLNINGNPILNHFGETAYYYFFDMSHNVIQISPVAIGNNPQVVPIGNLSPNTQYTVQPYLVLQSGTIVGPYGTPFSTEFDCVKKAPKPTGTGTSGQSNNSGGHN